MSSNPFKAEREEEAVEGEDEEETEEKDEEKAAKRKKCEQSAVLMQVEERNTGAVKKEVYKEYIRAGKGHIILPLRLLALSVALLQVSQVLDLSSY